jgi:hypothetical protein
MDVLLVSSLGAMAVLAVCCSCCRTRVAHEQRAHRGGSASTFWIVAADEEGNVATVT